MGYIKDENDYSGYGVASDGKGATLTAATEDGASDITIPAYWDGVPLKKIAFGAFRGNQDLVRITLPDTVETIESNAFRACPNLETVVLSRSLRTLAPYSFASNPRLKSVTLPSSVMSFNAKAFHKCPSLTDFIVYDMNKNGDEKRRFVVARINESRRVSYMTASLIYFDAYNMRKYDEGYGVLAEFDDRFNIAEYRLRNPDQLDDYMRRVYENEIYQSIPRIIRGDQVGKLTVAGDLNIITEAKIDTYLEMASDGKPDCLAYLLQYKEEHFQKHSLEFDL